MPSSSSQHPPRGQLRAYGLGMLDPRIADEIENHLGNCPDCSAYVAGISSDGFLATFRSARSEEQEDRPETLSATAVHASNGASGAPASVIMAPELAGLTHYEVLGELGQGRTGTVYLARNQLMGRYEALKVLAREISDRPTVLERFMAEIRAVAGLHHRHIASVYSVLAAGERVVLAMEYVDGLDLERLVAGRGPLPVLTCCYLASQAAEALHYIQEQSRIHGDVRPGNLLLTEDGERPVVRLMDFGQARAAIGTQTLDPGTAGPPLDLSRRTLAAPSDLSSRWTAPEVISGSHPVDIRADIYGLGCTLYYLLSGHPPFPGAGDHRKREGRGAPGPAALNLIRPEVPAELAAVVFRMMARNPEQRFQTPREVVKALAPYLRTSASARRVAGASSTSARATDRSESEFDLSFAESSSRQATRDTTSGDAGQPRPRAHEYQPKVATGDSSGGIQTRARRHVRLAWFWPVVLTGTAITASAFSFFRVPPPARNEVAVASPEKGLGKPATKREVTPPPPPPEPAPKLADLPYPPFDDPPSVQVAVEPPADPDLQLYWKRNVLHLPERGSGSRSGATAQADAG